MADLLAPQASNLLSNDAFLKAMHDIREHARDGLCRTPATDVDAIRDHQAHVAVVDELLDRLRSMKNAAEPKPAPGLA